MAKTYVIRNIRSRTGSTSVTRPMTIAAAVEYYSYTLRVGASWEHEKGNKKINCNPKTIASLITNLNNAVDNAAVNGYAGETFSVD